MLIIDRIEEDTAVLENTDSENGSIEMQKLPLTWLPEDVREGDVLKKTRTGYVVDAETTKRRRDEAFALLSSLQEG